ncbi:hypothetical protein B0H13DRAFT_2336519 [Mycena leptocephala]|nr:hypothetical protein B0H13DRAFT_2336519 [Mycena leptocephala]
MKIRSATLACPTAPRRVLLPAHYRTRARWTADSDARQIRSHAQIQVPLPQILPESPERKYGALPWHVPRRHVVFFCPPTTERARAGPPTPTPAKSDHMHKYKYLYLKSCPNSLKENMERYPWMTHGATLCYFSRPSPNACTLDRRLRRPPNPITCTNTTLPWHVPRRHVVFFCPPTTKRAHAGPPAPTPAKSDHMHKYKYLYLKSCPNPLKENTELSIKSLTIDHMAQIGPNGFFELVGVKEDLLTVRRELAFHIPPVVTHKDCTTEPYCGFAWAREWRENVPRFLHHPDGPAVV